MPHSLAVLSSLAQWFADTELVAYGVRDHPGWMLSRGVPSSDWFPSSAAGRAVPTDGPTAGLEELPARADAAREWRGTVRGVGGHDGPARTAQRADGLTESSERTLRPASTRARCGTTVYLGSRAEACPP